MWPSRLKMQEGTRIAGQMVHDAGCSLQELVVKGVAISSSKQMGKE